MEIVKMVLSWLWKNVFDIALVAVGASAFITYFLQQKNERKAASTLILDQIDSIEKTVHSLKEDYHHNNKTLDDNAVYLANEIAYKGAWNEYQYLMVKKLSQSELSLIQRFFESAYQIEKARADIVHCFKLGWNNKSMVTYLKYGQFMDPTYETKNEEPKKLIDLFLENTANTHSFSPGIAYKALYAELDNYAKLSGTTAYEKLHKMSFRNK